MNRALLVITVCALLAGCADSNNSEAGDTKRERDRLSYRNSALLRQVDEQTDRLTKLQQELDAAKKQAGELQAQLGETKSKLDATQSELTAARRSERPTSAPSTQGTP